MDNTVPDANQEPVVAPPFHDKRRILVISIIPFVVVLLVIGALFLFGRGQKIGGQNTNNTMEELDTGSAPDDVTPTPFPFQDMTVPFLRNRTYTSSLNEREVAYQGSNYTAYLSSYDSDGFRVNGLLTVPTGEEPEGGWPAIVFIHGYIPPTQYQTTGQYADYVDYLARNGFVVFKIDLRGHGNSEGEAGGGYYGSDYIVDVLNARAALASSGFVNPQEIGLWGHSMAGNVSMRAFAAQPDIPAVVIWAGAVYTYEDMQKYGIDDNSYRPPQQTTERQRKRQQLREAYGDPDPNHAFWKQVIPTNYLQDLKGAIEIHHAVDDDVVNVGYSRDLMTLLDKTQVPHELHEYQSGGHNINGTSFNEAMARTVDFYKKHLTNKN